MHTYESFTIYIFVAPGHPLPVICYIRMLIINRYESPYKVLLILLGNVDVV